MAQRRRYHLMVALILLMSVLSARVLPARIPAADPERGLVVSPGQHTLWSQVISQDAVTLDVEAGKTYYVKGDVRMGVYAGRPKFTRMPDDQAQSDLAELTGTTTPAP